MDEWYDLIEFPEYQINKNGEIRSLKRNSVRILKQYKTASGYMYISLFNKDNIRKSLKVHRLVASTFISNPNKYPIVDHIDGIRDNNNVLNLNWVNQSDNVLKSNHSCNSRKSVIQYDMDGNIIHVYPSEANASSTFNLPRDTIGRYIRKERLWNGYYFKYPEENSFPYKPTEDEVFKSLIYDGILYQLYTISNKGNILNVKTGKLKRATVNNGYPNVCLSINGKIKRVNVHRLVATMFVERKSEDHTIVNHIDENKLNYHSSNLEWVTPKQNVIYSNHQRQKKVSQIDINTNKIIKIYSSLKEAAAGVDLKSSAAICECCKGKRESVRGFNWEYSQ